MSYYELTDGNVWEVVSVVEVVPVKPAFYNFWVSVEVVWDLDRFVADVVV